MSNRKTVLNIVGARPNFMKIGPILSALKRHDIKAPLLHTGQHYDDKMNDRIFQDLDLPQPKVNLGVGSGTHAQQTAEVMRRFEPELDRIAPDAVLVVGDVNSTLACALVAVKKGIRVIHVEAGLRSFDRTMPEEINRILTDQISDFLFTTEKDALVNLQREGIAADKVFFVGNVMIDTLLQSTQKAVSPSHTMGRDWPGGHALVTLHRPSNVDAPDTLRRLVGCLTAIAAQIPVVFPIHPRTRAKLEEQGLTATMSAADITLLPPLGYLEMLGMTRSARLVVTDSGGLQEETTALGVPCLTVRENTERPITITQGTNTLVGVDPAAIMAAFGDIMASGGKAGRRPELWDGHAGERIAEILARRL